MSVGASNNRRVTPWRHEAMTRATVTGREKSVTIVETIVPREAPAVGATTADRQVVGVMIDRAAMAVTLGAAHRSVAMIAQVDTEAPTAAVPTAVAELRRVAVTPADVATNAAVTRGATTVAAHLVQASAPAATRVGMTVEGRATEDSVAKTPVAALAQVVTRAGMTAVRNVRVDTGAAMTVAVLPNAVALVAASHAAAIRDETIVVATTVGMTVAGRRVASVPVAMTVVESLLVAVTKVAMIVVLTRVAATRIVMTAVALRRAVDTRAVMIAGLPLAAATKAAMTARPVATSGPVATSVWMIAVATPLVVKIAADMRRVVTTAAGPRPGVVTRVVTTAERARAAETVPAEPAGAMIVVPSVPAVTPVVMTEMVSSSVIVVAVRLAMVSVRAVSVIATIAVGPLLGAALTETVVTTAAGTRDATIPLADIGDVRMPAVILLAVMIVLLPHVVTTAGMIVAMIARPLDVTHDRATTVETTDRVVTTVLAARPRLGTRVHLALHSAPA